MGQSLVKNYIHIVFSTKHRVPRIAPPYEEELHNYLGGICKNLESTDKNRRLYGSHTHPVHAIKKDRADEATRRGEVTLFEMDENKK